MDIDKVRKDTPNCLEKIFLNSAGASLMPTVVTETMMSYLQEEARVGGYKIGLSCQVQEAIHQFHVEVGKLLNCESRNVAYVSSATDGYAQALASIPWENGDVIITTDDDYISNHAQFWRLKKMHGITLMRVSNTNEGDIDLKHLARMVEQHKPRLVSVTHIPTNTGKVLDVYGVGGICGTHDILYIVDACQSAGQMPLDVVKMRCDFLVASGRKFLRGPRGTGFLYASDRVLERGYAPLRIDSRGAVWESDDQFSLRDSALRYELWEQSYANYLGFAAAIRYANEIGLDVIERYNATLLRSLRTSLSSMANVRLLDHGDRLGSICTFNIEGKSQQEIQLALDANEVYYSISSRESALIDFDKKGLAWAIRLSPHYFNTVADMENACQIVSKI